MEPAPNNCPKTLKCELHNENISIICTHSDCFNKLMCNQCVENHYPNHNSDLRSYMDILSDSAIKALQFRKEKLSSFDSKELEKECTSILTQIDSYFNDIAAKLQKNLQRLNQTIRGSVIEFIKKDKDLENWESLEQKLIKVRTSLMTCDSPDSQSHLFSDYFQAYTECVDLIDKALKRKDSKKEEIPKKLSIDLLGLDKFFSEFEKQCEIMTSNFILKAEELQSSLAQDRLQLDAIVPISNMGQIEATCTVGIKDNYFAVGSNNGRVLIWDAKTLTLCQNKDIHKGKITSLLYMQTYDVIVSAGMDKKMCLTRLEKNYETTTFIQIPIQEPIESLTEIRELGSFVGILGNSQIAIWSIKLTKFRGKDHYEVILEGKIPIQQKVKLGNILNITGKRMIAVSFDIGTISFFCLKEKKMVFGIYSGTPLLEFSYCERRQKLFAQVAPNKLQIWNLGGEKPVIEANIMLKSECKGPYTTILNGDIVFCCGGSKEVVIVDIVTKYQEKIELNDLEANRLLYIEPVHKLIVTNNQSSYFGVIKVKK